jgi:hypothetical protein
MDIDLKPLREKVEDLILDAAREAIPGPDKFKSVVRQAAAWAASQTKIPVPDVIEAAFYRMILGGMVQAVYDLLKRDGKV